MASKVMVKNVIRGGAVFGFGPYVEPHKSTSTGAGKAKSNWNVQSKRVDVNLRQLLDFIAERTGIHVSGSE